MRGRSSSSTCCSGCCAIVYGADHVTYVRNITDVDDKINARARCADFPGLPLNEAIRQVTEKTADAVSGRCRGARLPAADASSRAPPNSCAASDGKADMMTLISS